MNRFTSGNLVAKQDNKDGDRLIIITAFGLARTYNFVVVVSNNVDFMVILEGLCTQGIS